MFSSINSFHSQSKTSNRIKVPIGNYSFPLTTQFTGFIQTITGNTGNKEYQNGTYTISESSQLNRERSYPAWSAFNANLNPYNYVTAANTYSGGKYIGSVSTALLNSTSVFGEWVQIHYPYNFVLNNYTLVFSGDANSLNSWTILGSNNETDWVAIDSKTVVNMPPAGVITSYVTSITNTVRYSYYRFILQTSFGIYAEISSLNLYVP